MQRTRFDRTASPVRQLLLRAIPTLLLIVFLSWLWYGHQLSSIAPNSDAAVSVTVEKGMSASGVAAILKEKKLIRSEWAFTHYASWNGYSERLKSGAYVLHPSESVQDLLEVIVGGKQSQVVVTIPEGFTVEDIDALLAEKGLLKRGELLKCAQTCDFHTFSFLPTSTALAKRGGKVEGYLYPDTYFVEPVGFTAQAFLNRLLQTFQAKVVDTSAADIKSSGHTLDQVITMASLIEKETRTEEERPIVAGILWKRFDEKQGLAVDATVRYIVDKPTEVLTKNDLDANSPYNTRRFRGLPPGPIASPSLSSIHAAFHSKESPYYYYLHGKDGQIHYAKTNDEHNINRAKYL